MRQQYIKFMKDLGHIEIDHENQGSCVEYYLSHHYVFKSTSESTKFRVVFNGFYKTSSKSLNFFNLQYKTTFLKFGLAFENRFVFTADIIKIYCQINICDVDRNLRKIW